MESGLRLTFESLKLVECPLFEIRGLGKNHIAVNNKMRGTCKYIVEDGLASLLQFLMEVNHEKGG